MSISDLIKFQYNNLDYTSNSHNTTLYAKAKIIKNSYLFIYDIQHINLWASSSSNQQGSCVIKAKDFLKYEIIKNLFGRNLILFSLDNKLSLSFSITQTKSKKIKFSRVENKLLFPILQNSDKKKK